jgi:hypothetical protein
VLCKIKSRLPLPVLLGLERKKILDAVKLPSIKIKVDKYLSKSVYKHQTEGIYVQLCTESE